MFPPDKADLLKLCVVCCILCCFLSTCTPSLTRVFSVNTSHVAHVFVNSFIHSAAFIAAEQARFDGAGGA
jgi:hypothetical protein